MTMSSPARSPSTSALQALPESGGLSPTAIAASSAMPRPSNAPQLDHDRVERQCQNFRSSINPSAKAIISGEWSKVSKKPYKPKGGIEDPDHPKWRELVELQNMISECSASRRNCKTAEATAEAEYNAKMTMRRAFPRLARGICPPEKPESMRSRQATPEEDGEEDEEEAEEEYEDEDEEIEEPGEIGETEEVETPEVEAPATLPVADRLPVRAEPAHQLQATAIPPQDMAVQPPQVPTLNVRSQIQQPQPLPLPAFPHSRTARNNTAPAHHYDQSSFLSEEDDPIIVLPPRDRRTRVKRERDPSYSPEPSPRNIPGPAETKPKTTRNRAGDFAKRVQCRDRVELGFLRKEIINKHEGLLLQIDRELAMLPKSPGATGGAVRGVDGGADEHGGD